MHSVGTYARRLQARPVMHNGRSEVASKHLLAGTFAKSKIWKFGNRYDTIFEFNLVFSCYGFRLYVVARP